jgi:MFS family permease
MSRGRSVLLHYGEFYLSCLLAFTAGHMINYSVIIYAQEVLGSDLYAGIGFGLCFGPPIVLGWYAGVLCDRLAPARLIHLAQAAFVLAALVLLFADRAIAEPSARLLPLLCAALLAGVGWSFVSPARMAALAQVVERDELRSASVTFNLLVMLGFGLGPLMIAIAKQAGGWPGVFVTAAGLFVLGSVLLIRVPTRASQRPQQRVLRELREGLAAIAGKPLLAQLMIAAIVGYVLMGPMQVLLPRLATTQLGFGDMGRGVFLATLAVALMVGGLLALKLSPSLPNGRAILFATIAAGGLLAWIGMSSRPGEAIAMLFGVGVSGGLALSLIVAGIQVNSEEQVRGRVLATYTVISQVVPAASGIAAGLLSELMGPQSALILSGAVIAVATALNVVWMRALRSYVH